MDKLNQQPIELIEQNLTCSYCGLPVIRQVTTINHQPDFKGSFNTVTTTSLASLIDSIISCPNSLARTHYVAALEEA